MHFQCRAGPSDDLFTKGLDLSGSVTYTDSQIMENDGYVRVVGDTLGKRQPNIPVWRATALATYRLDANWSSTLGARYSGPQLRTLNNYAYWNFHPYPNRSYVLGLKCDI
jgi:iron complex outermembrane receptor protein